MKRRWSIVATRVLGGERGMALAMALVVLLVLSSLMMAFAFLARSEPVIAANQQWAAAARAMAESGLEQAIWALSRAVSSPGAPGGLAPPASGAGAAAPYDGGTVVDLGPLGGFTVRVTGVSPTAVRVESVGWFPSPASILARAHRRTVATLTRLPDLGRAAPGALCVRGSLHLLGAASASATDDTSCGPKLGAYTRDALVIDAPAQVRGADGNDVPDQPTDLAENQTTASFEPFTLTADDLDLLKALARSGGTYFQGRVTFDAAHPMPDGIVFVDTASGDPVTGATPVEDLADVTLSGDATVHTPWRGWLVVNGSLHLATRATLNGLVHVADALDVTGGDLTVNGLVIAGGARAGSRIDASGGGRATIRFDCAGARGTGAVPAGWFVRPGTYREVTD